MLADALGWSPHPLRARQQQEEPLLRECAEVCRYARGERVVSNEEAQLDVAVERSLGEIRRGDEEHLIVDDDRFRVEHARRRLEPPISYVETLADLEKADPKGRAPDDVVGNMADKTPVFHPYPNVVERLGVISYAPEPPAEVPTIVTTLWDRLLPGRGRVESEREPGKLPPQDDELLKRINYIAESEEDAGAPNWQGEPDSVVMQHEVPLRRGSWRLVPEGAENWKP